MDDATKKMMVTIAAPILRKGLITFGSALTTHGILASNQIETFVSLGMAVAGLLWSFWNDYGRAIVLSQLEVLKAKSLAQAAKLQAHDIAPPDAAAVAAASAKSPDMATLSIEEVKKAAATLPAAVAGTTAVIALLFIAMAVTSPALAQARRPVLTGNVPADIANAKAQKQADSDEPFACDVDLFTKLTLKNVVAKIKNCVGNVKADIAKPFADDLRDSVNSAKSTNDNVALGCYTPALALAEAGLGTPAVVGADGVETSPARPAGPILIFQKFREFVNAGGIVNCKTVVQSTVNGTVAGAL